MHGVLHKNPFPIAKLKTFSEEPPSIPSLMASMLLVMASWALCAIVVLAKPWLGLLLALPPLWPHGLGVYLPLPLFLFYMLCDVKTIRSMQARDHRQLQKLNFYIFSN
jgi:hypothetical protein